MIANGTQNHEQNKYIFLQVVFYQQLMLSVARGQAEATGVGAARAARRCHVGVARRHDVCHRLEFPPVNELPSTSNMYGMPSPTLTRISSRPRRRTIRSIDSPDAFSPHALRRRRLIVVCLPQRQRPERQGGVIRRQDRIE